MDISSFNIEEDSKVDCGYSLIINSESDSDSSPNDETPSDLGPSIGLPIWIHPIRVLPLVTLLNL
jgi:hypothetical protein